MSNIPSFGTIDAHDFMGKNGFIWWIGIVENRQDPLGMGRAQVRILGFHNETIEKIPTNELSWALALTPLGNSSSPKSPPEGSWVLGFFLDGILAQQPVMLGVLPGFRTQFPRLDAVGTFFKELFT